MGYQIIAVSPDHYSNVEPTLKQSGMKYTLVSDNMMSAAKAFGLAFRVSEATKQRYVKLKIDLTGAAKADHWLLPVPAVFVLDTEGVIQFEYINPNYKVRLDADILRAAAKAAIK